MRMKAEHLLLIAKYVGADVEQTRAFLLVAEMCGYSFAERGPTHIHIERPRQIASEHMAAAILGARRGGADARPDEADPLEQQMLGALRTAELALVNSIPVRPYPGDGPLVSIRAAIAKAEGRS